jgi:hypothetical protein
VYASRKRWAAWASATSGGKKDHHYLGTFDTKEEAALAHDVAARQAGGNRKLNFESARAAEEAAAAAAQASHSAAQKQQAQTGAAIQDFQSPQNLIKKASSCRPPL